MDFTVLKTDSGNSIEPTPGTLQFFIRDNYDFNRSITVPGSVGDEIILYDFIPIGNSKGKIFRLGFRKIPLIKKVEFFGLWLTLVLFPYKK